MGFQALLQTGSIKLFSLICPPHRKHLAGTSNVIRNARIATRQPIENVIKRNFGIFATGFTAGDYALSSLKSCTVDENDVSIVQVWDRRTRTPLVKLRSLGICD
jgi:hypothetical protein